MGKRVDPRRAVGPAHDLGHAAAVVDAFERVGQGLALEALRVGEHVADGAAGQVRVVERQLDIGLQHAVALALDRSCGRPAPDMPVRSTRRLACAAMNAARAFAISGASRCRSLALRSSSRARSTIDSGGQAATVSSTSPSTAIGRRLSLSCCSGGARIGPPSNTSRSGPAHHAVDDRALEQCAAGADHHPAEPGQPAAFVQRLAGTARCRRRPCSRHRRACRPTLATLGRCRTRDSPGAGRAARHTGRVAQGRQHRHQRRPEAAEALQLGRDAGRHALGVEVEQRERRSAIDDVGAGAGDDVRPRDAIELLLGDDLDLVGQAGAQRAERDGLRRVQASDQRARARRRRRS